jgi:predicted ester cyclase
MSTEVNQATVRRFYEEAVGQGNLDCIDELFAPDYMEHEEFAVPGSGIPALKQWIGMICAAFTDRCMKVDDIMALGDRVAVRWSCTSRHTGAFMGTPATNEPVSIKGMGIYRLADGKVVERWTEEDRFGMAQQMGLIPMRGAARAA